VLDRCAEAGEVDDHPEAVGELVHGRQPVEVGGAAVVAQHSYGGGPVLGRDVDGQRTERVVGNRLRAEHRSRRGDDLLAPAHCDVPGGSTSGDCSDAASRGA
jgi:hypothetical protein